MNEDEEDGDDDNDDEGNNSVDDQKPEPSWRDQGEPVSSIFYLRKTIYISHYILHNAGETV